MKKPPSPIREKSHLHLRVSAVHHENPISSLSVLRNHVVVWCVIQDAAVSAVLESIRIKTPASSQEVPGCERRVICRSRLGFAARCEARLRRAGSS
jgi:hypothetical protein